MKFFMCCDRGKRAESTHDIWCAIAVEAEPMLGSKPDTGVRSFLRGRFARRNAMRPNVDSSTCSCAECSSCESSACGLPAQLLQYSLGNLRRHQTAAAV